MAYNSDSNTAQKQDPAEHDDIVKALDEYGRVRKSTEKYGNLSFR